MSSKAEEFYRSIEKKENIVLVSHNDADGISSAALNNAFLKKFRGRGADYISINPMPPQYLLRSLKSTVPDRIIITDLAIIDSPMIEKVASLGKTMLIDHHTYGKISDFVKRNVVYYNPRKRNRELYQSASYLVYKLTSKIEDMSDRMWIAVVGIIGDYDISGSKDLLKEAKKTYPEIRMDIEKLNETVFGDIALMIYAMNVYKEKMVPVVELMSDFSSPYEFAKSEKARKYMELKHRLEAEIETEKERFRTELESRGKFIFFETHTRAVSIISTMLGTKHPDKIVVVYRKEGNRIKLSARNQGRKYNVGQLLREASSEVEGARGGGHPPAGGAQVPLSKWEQFKSALMGRMEN